MAGRGPAPKPPGQRRRRNKREEKELPLEGHRGKVPPLPKTWRMERVVWKKNKDGEKEPTIKVVKVTFLKPTRDWYRAWGRSPMAAEFTEVDWQRLQRVARLVDQYERNPAKDLIAEIRLQEAGFGGTPLDRRRLGQKIGKGDQGKQTPKPDAKSSDSSERRARLSVVK